MKKILTFVLIAIMAFTLAACGNQSSKAKYKDGTYEATSAGNNGDINVSVVVSGGKISTITADHQETAGLGDKACDTMIAAMIKADSTEVDTVSGATVTSKGLIEAVNTALTKAK